MRNTEKYNKEPWKAIVICFIWGATISIIAALVLELVLSIPVAISFQDASIFAIISAVIIAPFAEELTKPISMSLKTVKKELDEIEDGFIYGAIAGLGFSA
ncbi:MAG: PrsW family glutamic-type intramembrane protease, partial [Candidatus Thermoplasmatota archaeon]|nr:PrsW family glutamic-type intramembrane protease [Candidatus Thermoplasmatota archaeon]